MRPNAQCLIAIFSIAVFVWPAFSADFRVFPYIQNPTTASMSILWFSNDDTPGRLTYRKKGTSNDTTIVSTPIRTDALAYLASENETHFGGQAPPSPFRHRVRLNDLIPATAYAYEVTQGASHFAATFTTAPTAKQPIRFIAYADCETEPESTGKHVKWVSDLRPSSVLDSTYFLDQTMGYGENLAVIAARRPDFIAIAGDLVESGGEQRDWDEFWLHNTNADGRQSIAGQIPILATPGNHEYYAGPGKGYNQPDSERAITRFRTYFEFPDNQADDARQKGRYYRVDYGPITLIALDVANNSPNQSKRDTNFMLVGEKDPEGGRAPAFGPGSRQYAWLEKQLADAQHKSKFTFVFFHHVPYSVGPHGKSPGPRDDEHDNQSGVPVRVLTPLFMRYGVDAVLAGHDEIWERSEIVGMKTTDGKQIPHTIHFYDIGTGGDGLRAPEAGLKNKYQKFIAHIDAREIWHDGVLVDGGKHYGHLEVDVLPGKTGWLAILKPVYIFPLFSADGTFLGNERRLYNDIITLSSSP
ncbi:MAG: metallophosphoesterase family protein [Gemmatimonadetes bacterium]|jgi:3',5'-cyclic AMP phosphodiesterase CpdA|nr:metallophosphoesterase family protein [Gemmatimonadota bacterium]MBT5325765.1 metallophosphoesterase family protein [Gemmatimonadota bacterium]MBT5451144.1 metallophosphoesterase family protein [Gemmatimonadota bacterium]MBT5801524.1 metallophosphoesterase family protein [Gemmatimonadota bacterium]MBT6623690.1 metallophosphoesterase family protein [Gemmatimonadota bacterium]